MDEEVVGPRGKRLLYSKFFSGGIHKEDVKDYEEFGDNCSRKGIHMNYDGKKKDCGWSIRLKRGNKIERDFIPIAEVMGIDADVFIDEILDQFRESIKMEFKKTGVVKEIGMSRKNTISKTVSKVVSVN